jgi:hypothetical protein
MDNSFEFEKADRRELTIKFDILGYFISHKRWHLWLNILVSCFCVILQDSSLISGYCCFRHVGLFEQHSWNFWGNFVFPHFLTEIQSNICYRYKSECQRQLIDLVTWRDSQEVTGCCTRTKILLFHCHVSRIIHKLQDFMDNLYVVYKVTIN